MIRAKALESVSVVSFIVNSRIMNDAVTVRMASSCAMRQC